jgi:hypothetical protein
MLPENSCFYHLVIFTAAIMFLYFSLKYANYSFACANIDCSAIEYCNKDGMNETRGTYDMRNSYTVLIAGDTGSNHLE